MQGTLVHEPPRPSITAISPLGPLIQLREFFADFRALARRGQSDEKAARRALEWTEAAGPSALPLLIRTLESADAPVADLAARLLATCGGRWADAVRQRALRALRRFSSSQAAADRRRLAQAVAEELAGPDQTGLRERAERVSASVQDLVRGLKAPDDLRGAADLIVAQVDPDELGFLCLELLKYGGPIGKKLVEEIRLFPRPDRSRLTVGRGRNRRRQAGDPSRVVRRPRPDAGPSGMGERKKNAAPSSAPTPERLLDEAMYFLAEDRPAEAAMRLEKIAAREPHLVAAQSLLGLARLRAGAIEASLPPLAFACRQEPQTATHYFVLGLGFSHARRFGHAYLAFAAYLAFEDTAPDGDERRAFATQFHRHFSERAQARYPGINPASVAQADACFSTAVRLFRDRRFEQAQSALEQATRLLPGQPDFWAALATVFLASENREAAERCIARASALRSRG